MTTPTDASALASALAAARRTGIEAVRAPEPVSDALAGKRVTVMGLGTHGGGGGVARWLAEQGAVVTVTDMKSAEDLAQSIAELEDLPIRFVLGAHDPRDFSAEGADLIVRNPGVPRRAPLLEQARSQGVPVEMEMSLFLRFCPAPVIGVTGTKGKTTTATLTATLLRAHDPRTVLAGNMGVSALTKLAEITPETLVVLELSSWQIESLIEHGLSPHIGVITNISEDHLNTYDSFQDYADTKRGLLSGQHEGDVAILNADDQEVWAARAFTKGTVIPFGVGERDEDGAWLAGEELVYRWSGTEMRIPRPEGLALAGEHGARNALAAIAAAASLGASEEAIRRGLANFRGVPHRMEVVGEVAGVTFINDTTATAPAAAIAALTSLKGRRVMWIGGGADKKLDFAALARTAAERAGEIFLLDGTATPRLIEELERVEASYHGPYRNMFDAAMDAYRRSMPGDVVLLSPGCASFGLFRDEFDRGDQFRAVVAKIWEICEAGKGW